VTRRTRVTLTEAEGRAVRDGKWVRVDLGTWVEVGESLLRTKSALVGPARGGHGQRVAAWANTCLHQPLALDVLADPILLDGGVCGAPMDDARVHLMCHSHGALYRTSDGHCTSGPCEGQSLERIDVVESADGSGTIELVIDEE
jgi:nitrite reductase/ring-hydroxylating ferredoxin subunit